MDPINVTDSQKMPKAYDYLWAPTGYLISDQRIVQLLNSKTVQRLSYIGQNGPLNHISSPNGVVSTINRQMHSVGSMLMTLKIGGTQDEAIAALLHDIMHTAFSHCTDFVNAELNKDKDDCSSATSYHEEHKTRLLEQFSNELESILGSKWRKFLNEKNWPLIKKNNPFAIDIADYTVRDGLCYGYCSADEAREMSKYLAINDKRQLIVTHEKASIWWNELSQKTNNLIYATPWNVAMNHFFAKGLLENIMKNTISMEDLESVHQPTIEKDALQLVMESSYSKFLRLNNGIIWSFFPRGTNLTSSWIIVGEFDIRARIVNPPIKDRPIQKTKKKIETYILAYIEN